MKSVFILLFLTLGASAGEMVEMTYYDAAGNPIQMRVKRSEVTVVEPQRDVSRGVVVKPSTKKTSRNSSRGTPVGVEYAYGRSYYQPYYSGGYGGCVTPYRNFPSAYISRPITGLTYGGSSSRWSGVIRLGW